MKLITLTFIICLFITIAFNAYRYTNLIPGQTDCTKVYIESGASTGSLYVFTQYAHIEAGAPESIAEWKVGEANGCMMNYKGNLIQSMADTKWCYEVKYLFIPLLGNNHH